MFSVIYSIHLGHVSDWWLPWFSLKSPLFKKQRRIETTFGFGLRSVLSLLHVTAFWRKSCNTCDHACEQFYMRFVCELITMQSPWNEMTSKHANIASVGRAQAGGTGIVHALYWHPEVTELELHEYWILYNTTASLYSYCNTEGHAGVIMWWPLSTQKYALYRLENNKYNIYSHSDQCQLCRNT